MARNIAILRGINVGGKRIIRMDDLKSMLQNLGLENVETYIQSGNVFFDEPNNKSNSEIAGLIEQAIFKQFGFEVPAVVSSVQEIETAIKKNPFYKKQEGDIGKLHLTFLKDNPSPESIEKIESLSFNPDKFKIDGKYVFIYCEGKYHQTKLNNNFFEKNLNTTATTRNWKTVLKLVERGKH